MVRLQAMTLVFSIPQFNGMTRNTLRQVQGYAWQVKAVETCFTWWQQITFWLMCIQRHGLRLHFTQLVRGASSTDTTVLAARTAGCNLEHIHLYICLEEMFGCLCHKHDGLSNLRHQSSFGARSNLRPPISATLYSKTVLVPHTHYRITVYNVSSTKKQAERNTRSRVQLLLCWIVYLICIKVKNRIDR